MWGMVESGRWEYEGEWVQEGDHQFIDGEQSWVLAAYWRFGLEAKTRHDLRVVRRGNELSMKLGEREFGCYVEALPEVLYAGVTACEGINRFYNFEINEV